MNDAELTGVHPDIVRRLQGKLPYNKYLKWKMVKVAAMLRYDVHYSKPHTYAQRVALHNVTVYRHRAVKWIRNHIEWSMLQK